MDEGESRPRPAFRTWALHWGSALLALFLLITSIPPALTLSSRPLPGNWMDLHLSAGIALLAITILRAALMLSRASLRRFFLSGWQGASAIKYWTLLVVLTATLTGLPIYQRPPLGAASYVFNMVPMPTIIRLGHGTHNLVIDIHIALSVLLLVFLIAHVIAGLRRAPPSGRLQLGIMLWPWRRARRQQ